MTTPSGSWIEPTDVGVVTAFGGGAVYCTAYARNGSTGKLVAASYLGAATAIKSLSAITTIARGAITVKTPRGREIRLMPSDEESYKSIIVGVPGTYKSSLQILSEGFSLDRQMRFSEDMFFYIPYTEADARFVEIVTGIIRNTVSIAVLDEWGQAIIKKGIEHSEELDGRYGNYSSRGVRINDGITDAKQPDGQTLCSGYSYCTILSGKGGRKYWTGMITSMLAKEELKFPYPKMKGDSSNGQTSQLD
jgi:hypothetical protein